MSETELFACLILLGVCTGLLLSILLAVIRNGQSLRSIERALKSRDTVRASAVVASGTSTPRGEFETFLAEDPARQKLSKGEQFSAYRRWRQEKGLNWVKP
ncbi:MAG: hypothetical protein WCJ66_14650 [Verrucomicrobiota bacterium]